jgi:hypothetical protein
MLQWDLNIISTRENCYDLTLNIHAEYGYSDNFDVHEMLRDRQTIMHFSSASLVIKQNPVVLSEVPFLTKTLSDHFDQNGATA